MRALPALVSLAAVLVVAGHARAHGGTHPTPFPTGTPTPGPAGGTRTTPSGGVPTSGTTSSPGGLGWEDWWYHNKWGHLRIKRRAVAATGDAKPAPFAESAAGRFLKEQLRHPYFDVRAAACLALGKAGDSETAKLLLPSLADRNEEVREAAMLGLGLLRHGLTETEVVVVLRGQAKEKPRLRGMAALALGLCGDPAAGEALRGQLRASGEEPEVRAACALALGALGDPVSIEPLRRLLASSSEDEAVRAYAVHALARLLPKQPPTAAAEGSDAPASAAPGLDPVRFLFRNLLRNDTKKDVRRAIALAMGTLREEADAADVLRAMEADGDEMVKRFAMLAFAQIARETRLQPVARQKLAHACVGEGRHEGKGFAALALGLLGDPEGAGALAQTFQSGRHASLRAAGALALGILPHAAAEPELLEVATGRGDPMLRGHVLIALGMLRGRLGLPALRTMLKEEKSPEVRGACAAALGCAGCVEDIPALAAMLEDKNAYLRMSTVQALGLLRDDAALAPLMRRLPIDESDEVRALIVVAVGNIVARDEVSAFQDLARGLNYLVSNPAVDLAVRLR